MKLRKIIAEENGADSKQLEEIQNKMDIVETELLSLGAEKPSKEKMKELLIASSGEQGNTINWHPEELIDDFDHMYDIWGYTNKYGDLDTYHLMFQYDGNDPYLHKNVTKVIYDSISPGSQAAQYWVDETIKIYAQKLIGTGLGLANPLVNWLPWELLFTSPPSPNEISSSGDATVMTLNSVTAVKFVFVYDSQFDEWVHSLSTNRVNYSYTVTEAVVRNGIPYNDSEDFNGLYVFGNFNSANADAGEAFEDGDFVNTGMYKLGVYSDSKSQDEINISLHCPDLVIHMN